MPGSTAELSLAEKRARVQGLMEAYGVCAARVLYAEAEFARRDLNRDADALNQARIVAEEASACAEDILTRALKIVE